MKRKAVTGLLILLILCPLLAGCIGATPVPPVDTATDIAKLVEEGYTLNQVYGLMSPQLKDTTILHRAQTVERRKLSGAWNVGAVPGGVPEDSDAPYKVLIFPPDNVGADCYLIFFENESVIGSDWFTPTAADTINDLLEGSLTSE